jgi:hypothetical protein
VAHAVRESGAGAVVAPEEPEALQAAIREFQGASRLEYSENVSRYASRRWSPERVLSHLERCLVSVAASPTGPLTLEETLR